MRWYGLGVILILGHTDTRSYGYSIPRHICQVPVHTDFGIVECKNVKVVSVTKKTPAGRPPPGGRRRLEVFFRHSHDFDILTFDNPKVPTAPFCKNVRTINAIIPNTGGMPIQAVRSTW